MAKIYLSSSNFSYSKDFWIQRMKICILGNENLNDTFQWEIVVSKYSQEIEWQVINLCAYDWLEKIIDGNYDLFLAKPPGVTQRFKQLYDERLYILKTELGIKVYPTLKEVLIYENKRFLSFWLAANNIPHPFTWIFYNKEEALNFINNYKNYPIVGKINIGAAGKGIKFLNNKKEALIYIQRSFSKQGLKSRWYPYVKKGFLLTRIKRFVKNKSYRNQRLSIYKAIYDESQKGFIILQEYIPHEYEWRVVRIGDSFFAHKKLKRGEKASGTLIKEYGKPPFDLLYFVKEITDRHQLYSQSVDIFESDRGYLINEMQCIFGQSDPYQMLVNGIPGRYVMIEGNWIFEEGDFNTNQSYDLRLETALKLYREGKL
ncbi:MAG: hypothetical protein WCS13_05820 [Candidatus Cloacimonadaceae bacterium]